VSATHEIILEHSHPPQLPPLRWHERLALHVGIALIRWAEHAEHSMPQRSRDRFESVAARRELVEARHRVGLL
jgi:hypothetical protein